MMPIAEPMLPMAATVAPTVIPPTMTPFIAASVTQHHTMTGAAIFEQHVEQTVVHETHVGKQIVHERHIDQPVIHERHIDQPVIHERHIDQPVIHERHYEQPVIHERHIDKPIIHERHIEKPIIHERHIEKPIIHEKHYEQPVIHERHIDKPIIHEKHYEQPVIHEKHIVKPVIHEVHINRPVIHETIVAPARVEVMNHTEQTLIDQQYTTAAAIVHTEHASLPAQITVEHSVAPPIMAGSTLMAHSTHVRSSSPTMFPMPRSPTVLSAPRSPSSTMSPCSSMSVTSLDAGAYVMPLSPLVPAVVAPAPTYTLGRCQEVIVVNEPPMKPVKAEKHGHRHHLKQKLDQKLHRHH